MKREAFVVFEITDFRNLKKTNITVSGDLSHSTEKKIPAKLQPIRLQAFRAKGVKNYSNIS